MRHFQSTTSKGICLMLWGWLVQHPPGGTFIFQKVSLQLQAPSIVPFLCIYFGYILLEWHLNIEETRTPCTWPFVHGGRRTCPEVLVLLLCFLNRGHICSFAESTQEKLFPGELLKNIKLLYSVENFNGKK